MQESTIIPSDCVMGLWSTGLWIVSPCLESECKRDVTSCCLHQIRPARTTAKKVIEKSLSKCHCHACGDTNEDNFGSNLGTCLACCRIEQAVRNATQKKAKIEHDKEYCLTRPCMRCGVQFQYRKGEKWLNCEDHRGVK